MLCLPLDFALDFPLRLSILKSDRDIEPDIKTRQQEDEKRRDVVICHNSFPHFAQMARSLCELRRVLAPNGKLLILHDLSRARVNAIHTTTGGVIANDLLPPAGKMHHMLLASGFRGVEVKDSNTCYIAAGQADSKDTQILTAF